MAGMSKTFDLDVIVVSDYESDAEKTWADERRILGALANQDIGIPFRVILVENETARNCVPPDLTTIFPNITFVFCKEERSIKLKNTGVRHTQSEYVAVVESDCLPNKEWLRSLYEALRSHKEYSIASGRTTYGLDTSYSRCLSVLDRSFDDLGDCGPTPHASNNGAMYKRSVLERFPFPEAVSSFQAGRLRLKKMREAGIKFYFEPRAVMRHALGGYNFIRDFRRNTGHADMIEHNPKSISEIPRLLVRRARFEWADCRRMGPKYLKVYDWPLLVALFPVTSLLHVPGMMDAIKERKAIPNSAFR